MPGVWQRQRNSINMAADLKSGKAVAVEFDKKNNKVFIPDGNIALEILAKACGWKVRRKATKKHG
jgi:hypothetical protein